MTEEKRPPPRCPGCGDPLDHISVPEDDHPYYKWDGHHYVHAYEGTAHNACPGCGEDLSSHFTMTTPDDFDIDDYDNVFTDEHGVKRCCRYCTHFAPNDHGQYDDWIEDKDEGVCIEEGHPYSRSTPDAPLSPELCNAFRIDAKIKAWLEDITIDPDTGDLDIPGEVEAQITYR